MAHTCPECYQQCHCNGDIDDLLLDTEEAYRKCDCCPLYGIDEDIFDDERIKLKDRLILDFGDVKKCLLELEERIDELEKEYGAGITTFKTVWED